MNPGVTCVVPARLGSSRFPAKLLHLLRGKPVVVHALERAADAGCFDQVVCLTDSAEIGEAVAAHGFPFVLTGDAANGTERIARHLGALDAALRRPAALFVNLQGDEPAFPAEGLRVLCAALTRHSGLVHTLVHAEAPSAADLANPNRVKAALDPQGFVRDFVRAVPPSTGNRGVTPPPDYRLQLGAYGYSRAYLERYALLAPSARETELSHEILRAAPHQPGWAPIRAHFSSPGASVDVPADLENALRALDALTPSFRPSSAPQARLQGTPS